MDSKEFSVPNISCAHCVMTIKRELSALPGVLQVEGNAESKKVQVSWQEPATWESITSLLTEINYPSEA